MHIGMAHTKSKLSTNRVGHMGVDGEDLVGYSSDWQII